MGDQNWDGNTAFEMTTVFSRLHVYIVVVGRITAPKMSMF